MAYSTITKPGLYFNTITYTGDGTSPKARTGVGFQPDWVWSKARDVVRSHQLIDSQRGVNKTLNSDNANQEGTNFSHGYLQSFDSDGFTSQSGSSGSNNWNQNNAPYVVWNWKANGAGSANTDGSINSTVSANTTVGFSIVSYTGTGSNATIGHGLSSAPEIIFQKCRSNSSTWWHIGSTKISTGFNSYLHLNETDAVASDSSVWNNTNPTSSVFSVGSAAGTNGSSRTNIAYCFHSVKGYSKIGSYTGSGSTNGSYIHLGFKPAWTMYKRISSGGSGGWSIHDNKRSESNGNNPLRKYIVAQTSGTESTDDFFTIDHLSNGFKLRATDGESNASGVTYLYMAFAESPFVTGASGIPTTAR